MVVGFWKLSSNMSESVIYDGQWPQKSAKFILSLTRRTF